MKRLIACLLTGMLGFGMPPVLAEETESASPLPGWLNEIEIHSFLSLGYVYNFNDPDSKINSQRFFDFKHNQFRVDDFQFTVLKGVQEVGDAGFRVDLDAGSNIPDIIQSAGLFDDPDGEDIDLRQAFLSYKAPLGNGLTIDFGKYITHFGLEVIEGWPGFNDNYSHSYDFSYAIPFTHTGLRLSYQASDKVGLMLMAANGWDKVDDNNDAKAIGGQISFIPLEDVTLYFNYIGSAEQDDNDDDWRHLFGLTWVTKPISTMPELTFSGTFDYGMEDNVGVGGRDAEWFAVQGDLKYEFSESFYVAVRLDYMSDDDGARISAGTPQDVWAFTITPTFLITDHLVVRPEFRYDESNEDVFEDDDGAFTEDSQVTIGINAIYYF